MVALRYLLPLAALVLVSCQTPQGSFCDLAKPIRISPEQIDKLTDEQVRDFLGHNTRGQKLCGWRA